MSEALGKAIWGIKLTPAKRQVLRVMAEDADANGNCAPGMPYLAWATDYSERQVRRIVDELTVDGIVSLVEKRYRHSTVWHIDLTKGTPKPAFEQRDPALEGGLSNSAFEARKFKFMLHLAGQDGMKCHYCGANLSDYGVRAPTMPTLDHKIPQSHGGRHELANLVLCCSQCNSRKSDTYSYEEYVNLTTSEREQRSTWQNVIAINGQDVTLSKRQSDTSSEVADAANRQDGKVTSWQSDTPRKDVVVSTDIPSLETASSTSLSPKDINPDDMHDESEERERARDSTPIPFHIANGLGRKAPEDKTPLVKAIEQRSVWQAFVKGWDGIEPMISEFGADLIMRAVKALEAEISARRMSLDDIEAVTRWKVQNPKTQGYQLRYVQQDLPAYRAYQRNIQRQRSQSQAQQQGASDRDDGLLSLAHDMFGH